MGLGDRITASVTGVRSHAQRLVQLNVELLKAELQKKGQQYGAAAGMLIGAGVLALYAVGFLLALIVVVLDIWLPLWLSLLIVTAALFVIVAILIAVGRGKLQHAKTPKPEAAVAAAQATVDQLRGGVTQPVESVVSRARRGGTTGPADAPGGTPGAPPGSSQPVRPAAWVDAPAQSPATPPSETP
jgi:Flp pilus assembly protein TadB